MSKSPSSGSKRSRDSKRICCSPRSSSPNSLSGFDQDGSFFLEINRFAIEDNPNEDISTNFYILNTNFGDGSDPTDHDDMIEHGKAAAYFTPWKNKIDRLNKGDTIFLYQTRSGIVGMGRASGRLEKAPYQGNPDHASEEHFMTLDAFQRVDPPLPASEIKAITKTNYSFRSTLFSIDEDSGISLRDYMNNRSVA